MSTYRRVIDKVFGGYRFSSAAVLAAVPATVLAHVDGSPHEDWAYAWNLTPEILLGTVVLAALYANGVRNLWGKSDSAEQLRRHLSFFGGLAAVFIALQSPLDAIANRSFFAHQVQHLLLQTVAPMLIMLAAPQRLLMAGTPEVLKRWLLVPVFFNRAVRCLIGFLALPWVAALLMVASLYVWHWPPYHNFAVLNDGVHYLMHFTLLAAGLLFYWCVFDPRPAPLGAAYGTRWNILLFTMTASMLLGAAIALKNTALYAAYDRIGRPWEMIALTDESIGGLIMWIPGSTLCVPAFLLVLRMWNSRESRLDQWRRRGVSSTAPATSAGNSRLALRLVAIALAAFTVTLSVGMVATGQVAAFSNWLLRTFPALGRIG